MTTNQPNSCLCRANGLCRGLARRWLWLYGTETTAGWGAWCKDLFCVGIYGKLCGAGAHIRRNRNRLIIRYTFPRPLQAGFFLSADRSRWAACIAMHESEWRSVWAHTVPIRHIFGHFQFVNPWLIAAYQTRAILGAPPGALCKKRRRAPRAAPTLINCFFYR